MRSLSILFFAALTLPMEPAHAVVMGTPERDPNGLRRSVVAIESSVGELCSGAVIGPDLILTAAHCVTDRAAYRVVAQSRTFKRQSYRVVAIAVHPTFVPGTTPRTQPGVDLAIVRTERPLGPDFTPLNPVSRDEVGVGGRVTIAGYGVRDESLRGTARVLRRTAMVSLGPVEVANRVLIVTDPERLGQTIGAGACRGDSGGPILSGANGDYRIHGIVSWSSGPLESRTRRACGGLTAVTPVAENLGWITTGMQGLAGLEADWARR